MVAKAFRNYMLLLRENEGLLRQKDPKFRDFLTARFFLFALLPLGMLVASLFMLRPLSEFIHWYIAQVPGLIGVISLFMAMFAVMSFLNSPVRADGEIPTLRDMAVRISLFAAILLGIFGGPLLYGVLGFDWSAAFPIILFILVFYPGILLLIRWLGGRLPRGKS